MANYEARCGLWHAAALCLVAGYVDAIGYLELGHVFTANMTGNTVLLGVAIAKGDSAAFSYIATIAAFAIGVVASTLLRMARVPLPAVFILAGAVLVSVTLSKPGIAVSLCLLAFVMGLQGGAISTFSGIRLPTVVVTSTLVNLIDGLVRRGFNRAEAPPPPAAHMQHLAAAWIAYGVGGGAAVIDQKHLATQLIAPAIIYAIVSAHLYWKR